MSAMVKSISASCAIASMCRMVLVEPPMAMSSVHRVLERLEAHGARQHRFVVLLVVALAQLHGQCGRRCLNSCSRSACVATTRAVAGQRKAQRFGQAVHGVGGEHARAGTAGRAGRALDFGHIGSLTLSSTAITMASIRSSFLNSMVWVPGLATHLARLHRAARHKHHRDVQAHGGHQHAGGDLVAVGDAHHARRRSAR